MNAKEKRTAPPPPPTAQPEFIQSIIITIIIGPRARSSRRQWPSEVRERHRFRRSARVGRVGRGIVVFDLYVSWQPWGTQACVEWSSFFRFILFAQISVSLVSSLDFTCSIARLLKFFHLCTICSRPVSGCLFVFCFV